MNLFKSVLLISLLNFVWVVFPSVARDNGVLKISKIQYTEREIQELSEIPIHTSKAKPNEKPFENKVDELIGLLESHKKAVDQGQNLDRIQETVLEINQLLEKQKNGPAKLTTEEFHASICFKCHNISSFAPSDKTRKQWLRLIEDDGHAIFENISWESPYQKKQILEFLLENAGTYRAEGIGLWD